MKLPDGYVKITGLELADKAFAVLVHLDAQNKLLEQQDEINRLEFEAKLVSDKEALDAYRDSGNAWADFEKARIKYTKVEPIYFLCFQVGTNEIVNTYGISEELNRINYKFWSNLYSFDVEKLTFEKLSKFGYYELDRYPRYTQKHETQFLADLAGMADKPEIFLSIEVYRRVNQLWLDLTLADTPQLLVG